MAKVGFELGSLTLVMMWSVDVMWDQPGLNTHLLGLSGTGQGDRGGTEGGSFQSRLHRNKLSLVLKHLKKARRLIQQDLQYLLCQLNQ